jgi:hypothetical protein
MFFWQWEEEESGLADQDRINIAGRLKLDKPSPKEGVYLNLANGSSGEESEGGFCSAT